MTRHTRRISLLQGYAINTTLLCADTLAVMSQHGARSHDRPAARRCRRGLALAAALLTLVGCADSTEQGRQEAKDMALRDAEAYTRDAEVAAISRTELGNGSVRYLREHLAKSNGQVLDSWSSSGMAEPGPVVGWVDVALTRTSSDSVFSKGATVTTCIRFEVYWSDRNGAQYSHHAKDCPADISPPPAQ
ncbi:MULTISPECIES: hypothetical protein [Micromonospora]|uniref:hypothetical protein n=1 Tax=Micromonospora TaxID=1873 RepID=UPI0008DA2E0E|nr:MULTISPECIES: hypothetical protein [Micromonospora]OHX05583.1 hypothetical protein BFV98_22640 [Micromonospora sp. WMMB235]